MLGIPAISLVGETTIPVTLVVWDLAVFSKTI